MERVMGIEPTQSAWERLVQRHATPSFVDTDISSRRWSDLPQFLKDEIDAFAAHGCYGIRVFEPYLLVGAAGDEQTGAPGPGSRLRGRDERDATQAQRQDFHGLGVDPGAG